MEVSQAPSPAVSPDPPSHAGGSGSESGSDNIPSAAAPLREKANAWLEGARAAGVRVREGMPERLQWMKEAHQQVRDDFDQAIETIDDRLKDAMKRIPLHYEKAKARLLDYSAPLRKDVLSNMGSVVKSSMLADPDMWSPLRGFFTNVLDHLWEDIEHEIEQNIERTLLKQQEDEDVEGPQGSCGSCVRAFRSFVLYHYLPFNRSFFGKLKDPWYVCIYVLLLLPIHGFRVLFFSMVLVFLVFPGPADEYQLLSFILLFKGNQFLSQGILMTICGAMQYYGCYSWDKDNFLECVDRNGPSAGHVAGPLLDYLGSILLVWIAFFALRWSKVFTKGTFVGRAFLAAVPPLPATNGRGDVGKVRGGRMVGLLWWDIKCFLLSATILAVLTCTTTADFGVQFRANLFWCRVLYALLALPFWFFQIPAFLQVLTHSTPTGFNEQGACVEFELPPMNLPRAEAKAAKLRRAQTRQMQLGGVEEEEGLLRRSWFQQLVPDPPPAPGLPEEIPATPRDEAGLFEVLQDTDVFPGENAAGSGRKVQSPEDLKACMRVCRVRGFGAFVVWRGIAYFRNESVLSCQRQPGERHGATTYLNWNPSAASFEEAMGKDTLPESFAERRSAKDLAACLRHCRMQRYGAMVVRKGTAYYKQESPDKCQGGLCDSGGCTTYINWAPRLPAAETSPEAAQTNRSSNVLSILQGPSESSDSRHRPSNVLTMLQAASEGSEARPRPSNVLTMFQAAVGREQTEPSPILVEGQAEASRVDPNGSTSPLSGTRRKQEVADEAAESGELAIESPLAFDACSRGCVGHCGDCPSVERYRRSRGGQQQPPSELPPDLPEHLAQRPAGGSVLQPGCKLQWMWSDANLVMHALADLQPAWRGDLRPPTDVASELEAAARTAEGQSRPVQLREASRKDWRTFPTANLAALWIREQIELMDV